MFLKLNDGVVFDQGFLGRHGLDGYLRVPMSTENFEVPAELKTAFEKVLHAFRGVEKTEPKVIEEFLAELKKHEKLLH
jgi:hypothetical protein